MGRIFITGSADGLGQLAARSLITMGHKVVLHARNEKRAKDTWDKLLGAESVLTGDLSDIDETKALAEKVNDAGRFDAIIHNAGVYNTDAKTLFHVNTLAPYLLTCLVNKPQRLIYLSSDMHKGGHAKLDLFKTDIGRINYSDTKLHVLLLCKALARRWTDVFANAVNPGWVPTKMGGRNAPDDLTKGYETQVWLSVSSDPEAMVSGKYFFHRKESSYNSEADVSSVQERFLKLCEEITGVSL